MFFLIFYFLPGQFFNFRQVSIYQNFSLYLMIQVSFDQCPCIICTVTTSIDKWIRQIYRKYPHSRQKRGRVVSIHQSSSFGTGPAACHQYCFFVFQLGVTVVGRKNIPQNIYIIIVNVKYSFLFKLLKIHPVKFFSTNVPPSHNCQISVYCILSVEAIVYMRVMHLMNSYIHV